MGEGDAWAGWSWGGVHCEMDLRETEPRAEIREIGVSIRDW